MRILLSSFSVCSLRVVPPLAYFSKSLSKGVYARAPLAHAGELGRRAPPRRSCERRACGGVSRWLENASVARCLSHTSLLSCLLVLVDRRLGVSVTSRGVAVEKDFYCWKRNSYYYLFFLIFLSIYYHFFYEQINSLRRFFYEIKVINLE